MFNPEKLLGGLLGGSGRRGGANLLTSQLGMGLLGVAIAAAEHYMNKSSPQATPAAGGHVGGVPPSAPGASPPPPPGTSPAAAPPPPPGPGPAASPPSAPPGTVPSTTASQGEAVLLIRAMIAAANADGTIDQEERQRILDKFQGANLSPEEHTFLVTELLSPASMEAIASQVSSEALARQVYGVSLLAVNVDTEAERVYLQALGQRLGIAPAERDTMHKALGIANM